MLSGHNKPKSAAWKAALSRNMIGNTRAKGLKRGPQSAEHKAKMVATRIANGSYVAWNRGTAKPKILKPRPSGPAHHAWKGGDAHLPNCLVCEKRLTAITSKWCVRHKGNAVRGPNNINWKGGVTPEHEKIRKSKAYLNWRERVLRRDDYTCQRCAQRGGDLEVDHELPFSLYPALRLELLNGRTLCEPCHKTTDTWGKKLHTFLDYYSLTQ